MTRPSGRWRCTPPLGEFPVRGRAPWTTPSLTGDGRLDRIVYGEHLRQSGDFEDLQDAVLGAHQSEIAVVASEPLQSSDQHAQPGRVEEVHSLEVDNDLVLALADELDELLPETRSG